MAINVTDKKLNRYYKAIRKELACDSKHGDELFNSIKANIEDYICEHPDADVEEIRQHFGTAAEIAEEYYATEDSDTIKRGLNKSRGIIVSVLAFVVVAIVFYFVVASVSFYISERNHVDSYNDEGATEFYHYYEDGTCDSWTTE